MITKFPVFAPAGIVGVTPGSEYHVEIQEYGMFSLRYVKVRLQRRIKRRLFPGYRFVNDFAAEFESGPGNVYDYEAPDFVYMVRETFRRYEDELAADEVRRERKAAADARYDAALSELEAWDGRVS